MNTRMRPVFVRSFLAVVVVVALIGCSANKPAQQVQQIKRVFFPEPPTPPRLQFLVSFRQGRLSVEREKTSFGQWIVGKEQKSGQSSDRIDTPYGVAAHNGRVYVCDVGLNVVHVADFNDGSYSRLGTETDLKNPVNITIGADGTKYLCDSMNRKILIFDANDEFIGEFGDTENLMPLDVAIGEDELYITDVIGGEIEVWSKDGKFLRAISRKGVGPDELDEPTNLELGPDGRIYVTDTMGQIVKIFDRKGNFLGTIGQPGDTVGSFARPKGIAIDPHGHLYVVEAQWQVVQLFDKEGRLLLIVSGRGGTAPSLSLPAGIAIDKTSLSAFKKYIDPQFEAEYLVFLVNQYGAHKIAVYAFGRATNIDPAKYEVDLSQETKTNAASGPQR